jgi:hypothetical protein
VHCSTLWLTYNRATIGGKHFSRDLKPVDSDGNEISMWSEDAQKQFADEDEDEEEEDSDEESDDESKAGPSREDKKNLKKARKDAAIAKKKAQAVQVGDLPPSDSEEDSDDDDDDMPANPNHSKASRSQALSPSKVEEATDGVNNMSLANRRERESAEAQLAKERYQKLHEQGKTDEAKADMARLKLIREQRDAEAARRQVCFVLFKFAYEYKTLINRLFRLRRRRERHMRRPRRLR